MEKNYSSKLADVSHTYRVLIEIPLVPQHFDLWTIIYNLNRTDHMTAYCQFVRSNNLKLP